MGFVWGGIPEPHSRAAAASPASGYNGNVDEADTDLSWWYGVLGVGSKGMRLQIKRCDETETRHEMIIGGKRSSSRSVASMGTHRDGRENGEIWRRRTAFPRFASDSHPGQKSCGPRHRNGDRLVGSIRARMQTFSSPRETRPKQMHFPNQATLIEAR